MPSESAATEAVPCYAEVAHQAHRWTFADDYPEMTCPGSTRWSVVEDGHGNLWRWYPDVGYVLLITISKSHTPAEATLDALVGKVGPIREWVPA